MSYILPDLNHLTITSELSSDGKTGKFTVEPLAPGYGVTVGNTLRRILLGSLEGSAARSVKIEGASHEFSTLKGVKEDVVDLTLNLKTLRVKLNRDEPAAIKLSAKGPGVVTAGDFKKSSSVEIIDPKHHLATLERGGKLEMEIEVAKGRGYEPVEKRTEEKLPVGTIMVDSIFTPVKKVKYDIENVRVGDVTNYNKLVLEIGTDGSISPALALKIASRIMSEHLGVIDEYCAGLVEAKKAKAKKPSKKAGKPTGVKNKKTADGGKRVSGSTKKTAAK